MLHSLVMISALALPGAFTDVVDLDFSSQDYDRTLFRPNLRQSRGRWEVKDGALHAIIPKGPVGRPPIGFVGLFGLEGDFDFFIDYRLLAFPKPAAASGKNRAEGDNTVEISVSGPAGWVVVSRKHLPIGERVSIYGELTGMRRCKSELMPVGGDSGRLEARREGEIIHFYRSEGGEPAIEIGAIPFGSGPVSDVSVQLYGMNTTDALDVQISRIHVEADWIGRGPGTGSSRRPMLTWSLAIAGTLGIGLAARWFATRRRETSATRSRSRHG